MPVHKRPGGRQLLRKNQQVISQAKFRQHLDPGMEIVIVQPRRVRLPLQHLAHPF
jgi:hypothetical protein